MPDYPGFSWDRVHLYNTDAFKHLKHLLAITVTLSWCISIRMQKSLPKRFRYACMACAWTSPCPGSHKSLLQFLCQYGFAPWHHPVSFYRSEDAAFKQCSYFWYQRSSQLLCHSSYLLNHSKEKAQKTLLLTVTPGWGLLHSCTSSLHYIGLIPAHRETPCQTVNIKTAYNWCIPCCSLSDSLHL